MKGAYLFLFIVTAFKGKQKFQNEWEDKYVVKSQPYADIQVFESGTSKWIEEEGVA